MNNNNNNTRPTFEELIELGKAPLDVKACNAELQLRTSMTGTRGYHVPDETMTLSTPLDLSFLDTIGVIRQGRSDTSC